MSPPKVYCLYTGGTIGCAGNPLTPLNAKDFSKLVAKQPGFILLSNDGGGKGLTTLELNVNVSDEEDSTIHVVMDDIKPAIDSSSMNPSDWVLITQRILQNYDEYAGIVVLHGTDTMAFSASAISYMLGHGVSKPVIFTGSQVPLSKTRNDAQRNLITSLTIAATQPLMCEVALCFGSKLLRGNRSVKVSSSAFPAFASPNFAPLGSIGIEITTHKPLLLNVNKDISLDDPVQLQKRAAALERAKSALKEFSVIVITLHPGIRASFIQAALEHTKPPVKGVILQAFGAGNAPADQELLGALKKLMTRKESSLWILPKLCMVALIWMPMQVRLVSKMLVP